MHEIDLLLGTGVFVSAFAINALGSLAVRRTAEGKAVQAAGLDSVITMLNAVVIYSFINNPSMIFFEAIGCFLGSYTAVKIDGRKSTRLKLDKSSNQ